jgi:glucosyl-3-phosphoglycerate phosphatase
VSRRVVVLRHGRTAWNAERRFQGQADPPLDDVGRAQAYEVALLIAAMAPQLIITSDLARAVQTATAVGQVCDLEVVQDKGLRERSLGHWEGLTRYEVEQSYPEEFADWAAGGDVSRRGGETRDQVAERALAVFQSLPDVETTVLVTHSATAMALCAAVLGLTQRVHVLSPLANCHWSELRRDESDITAIPWRLRSHNVGAPGPVIPFALRPSIESEDDAADAQA